MYMDTEMLKSIDTKLDKINDKLDKHLERIAVVEERERTTRGSIAILFTILMTIAGWVVYKLKIGI
jgi:hypothetical protein